MAKKIAVLLCGSGFLDGSEIRESIALLWSLSESGAQVQCFAPDKNQTDVMNCLTRKPMENQNRNMLVEAARIARSEILPLSTFRAQDYSGLAIPGGYGIAKNLCSFASEGSSASVESETMTAILSTFQEKKPILAICIAPALVALALKGLTKVTLTLGEDSEASQEIEKLGHIHSEQKVTAYSLDIHNKVVSTPAYMYADASLADIFTGIRSASQAFLSIC